MDSTRGLPMHVRVALAAARSPDSAGTREPPEEPCPGRHCWVTGGAGAGDLGLRRPGLLVEWRRTGTRWEGRVVYLSAAAPGRWVLTEEWFAADLLATE